ncbi:GIY-YIG nuclease family protein [Octadecabacter sp. SW4]|uniref:GIY-YIG nuclease family protein n=1 Tax=Octadecabacter sp. SW4 TaxID=2602067 RepID=UPI0011C1D6A0|nr:GIY-YIG nuclease family protein [Octadecabacter sp. SW4]QEE36466.1 GIY-YIG nuclease family protein [Octadecabacter sp. SW4]
MARKFSYVVYKITFPNGKIYIGKDIGKDGHTIRYFGSWNFARVEADFTKDELRDFTIRREILFEGPDKVEVGRREMALIVEHGANDPERGYNTVPKFRSTNETSEQI